MTTKIFSSRHTPLQLSTPTSVLSWMSPSPDYSCLLTGQDNGCIGVTWYPTQNSTSLSHYSSLTLSYDCLARITHIATSQQHSHAAIADANGTLMLLSIKQPHTGVTRMLTSISNIPQTIVGVDWSNSGSNLACLRANAQGGSSLSLLIYSNLSQTQIGHTEVSFPRSVVRQSLLASERNAPSQRVAWSQDDLSIFITTPDHSLIQLSSQTWQITARLYLNYCTRLQLVSPSLLLVSNTEARVSLYNTNSSTCRLLRGSVDNWIFSQHHNKLLAVIRQENSCYLSVLSLEGNEVSHHELATDHAVTSLSLSPDSTALSYTTGSEMGSFLLYSRVPTLSDLCMSTIGQKQVATGSLPERVQQQVSIHHSVLFYPSCLSDSVEVSVCNMERSSAIGRSRRLLLVKKDHLGQELDFLRFTQSHNFFQRSVKLNRKQPCLNTMLSNLLSSCLTDPPSNSKIKWNSSKTEFTLRTGADNLRLAFSEDRIVVESTGAVSIVSVNKISGILFMHKVGGTGLAKISHDNNLFRIKLYKVALFSQLQTLMIVLAYIIRNF